jgi:nitrate reductase NapE component
MGVVKMSDQSSVTSPKTRSNKKLFALITAVVVCVIVVGAVAFFVQTPNAANPQVTATPTIPPAEANDSISLVINYTVGEEMVYDSTTIVTNSQFTEPTPSVPDYNLKSTATLKVLSFDGENYTLSTAVSSQELGDLPAIENTISKNSAYNNLLAPGLPFIFLNTSGNPTLSAFTALTMVKVGDSWQLPFTMGNESLGSYGNLTVTFEGIQQITTPAGTYNAVKITTTGEYTARYHLESDQYGLNQADDTTTHITAETYIEYGTCRIIKTGSQLVANIPSVGMSTTIMEKTLVEHKTGS